MPITLLRLFARRVISTVAIVWLVFVVLLTLLEMLRQAGDYSFGQALLFAALKAPYHAAETLLFACLIGCTVAMQRMAASNEMVGLRATGLSPWQILSHLSLIAVVFAVAYLLLSETMLAKSAEVTRGLKNETLTTTNLWLRNDRDFIHINQLHPGGRLEDITIYRFSNTDTPENTENTNDTNTADTIAADTANANTDTASVSDTAADTAAVSDTITKTDTNDTAADTTTNTTADTRGDTTTTDLQTILFAKTAVHQKNQWQLHSITIVNQNQRRHFAEDSYPLPLTPESFSVFTQSPRNMSLADAVRSHRQLARVGQRNPELLQTIWQHLLVPPSLILLIAAGIWFIGRRHPQASAAIPVLLATLAGGFYYLLLKITIQTAATEANPTLLAAPLLLLAAAVYKGARAARLH